MDTCWIDGRGEMLFTRAGEIQDEAQAEAFIRDNDILFSLSFGPVMIEHGVDVTPDWYLLGEANRHYPRACLAQCGELHYLPCISLDCITVADMTGIMLEKGVERCYALDGGQSGTLVMEGTMLNPSSYGWGNIAQRIQSDIIYFATAIPETN